MPQPSEGQRRQELLFALEEFKKYLVLSDIDDPTYTVFEKLVTILLKGM